MKDSNKDIYINNTYNYSIQSKKNNGIWFRIVGGALSIVFIVLLAITFIRVARGGDVVTFAGFMDWLTNGNTVVNSFTQFTNKVSNFILQVKINANWYVLNPLKEFFNSFIDLESLLVYISGSAVYVLEYVLSFVTFLFG